MHAFCAINVLIVFPCYFLCLFEQSIKSKQDEQPTLLLLDNILSSIQSSTSKKSTRERRANSLKKRDISSVSSSNVSSFDSTVTHSNHHKSRLLNDNDYDDHSTSSNKTSVSDIQNKSTLSIAHSSSLGTSSVANRIPEVSESI